MKNGYYKTKESVQEYIELAKDVSGADLIKQFTHFLPPKLEVLEIGSGPGTDWKILNETYHVVGSDNSNAFLSHLTLHHPIGEFLFLDAVTLETSRTFDGIYANKVLHHLTDQELITSIKRQIEILNPGGIVCHSFWKGEGSEVFNGLFVNYHTIEETRELYQNWFDVLLLESYQEFDAGDSIIIIGKKKE
jgi:2-polyprenyl-3-methyl-5-hydroxy-6-metoxy-1,4-benzoquinol methylase